MELTTKIKIAEQLRQKKTDTGMSDNQLGNQIGEMSGTLVNHIVNNRWEDNPKMVSDEAFRKVASWLGVAEEWVVVKDDYNFMKVQKICADAKLDSDSFAISAAPGFCKSEAAHDFANRRNVFYVKCSQHYTRKVFLSKIMQAMGMSLQDEGTNEMVDRIVMKLNSISKPLMIIDEADKLGDNLFQFFITFYNDTYTNCGFVFLGSVFFKLRVIKGVNRNRQGYAEFFSRIGRQFIGLQDLTQKRVTAICKANGVHAVEHTNQVWNECENDLRRVKRKIEDVKKLMKLEKKTQLTIEEVLS